MIPFQLTDFSLKLQLSCSTTPIESLPGAADSWFQQIKPTPLSLLSTKRTADKVSNLSGAFKCQTGDYFLSGN